MALRKVTTHHARRESLPEILAEIEKILGETQTSKKILLTQVLNSIEGFFYELIIVVEA